MYKLYASRMCTLVSGIRVHWSIVKEKSSACKRRSHYLSNRLKLTFLCGETTEETSLVVKNKWKTCGSVNSCRGLSEMKMDPHILEHSDRYCMLSTDCRDIAIIGEVEHHAAIWFIPPQAWLLNKIAFFTKEVI